MDSAPGAGIVQAMGPDPANSPIIKGNQTRFAPVRKSLAVSSGTGV